MPRSVSHGQFLARILARTMACFALVSSLASSLAACGGPPGASATDPITESAMVNVVGVPDRGLDPSIVAVTNALGTLCSGVLLAADVVLTARHCVSAESELVACEGAAPTADPATIHVYAGVPGPSVSWLSAGVAVLTSTDPSLCGADLALVVLSSPVSGDPVSIVSESGMAQGGHVRTVGLGWAPGATTPSELLREHLGVLEISSSELAIGEASCVGTGGSPAFDETTGQVVGVLARWGSSCGSAEQFDVFTRTDAFYGLIQQALSWAPSLAAPSGDGGLGPVDAGRRHDAGHTKKPPTDIGAACSEASDCGTGLCVTAQGAQYCSRPCSSFDSCPTDFKCVLASGGASVCVQT